MFFLLWCNCILKIEISRSSHQCSHLEGYVRAAVHVFFLCFVLVVMLSTAVRTFRGVEGFLIPRAVLHCLLSYVGCVRTIFSW